MTDISTSGNLLQMGDRYQAYAAGGPQQFGGTITGQTTIGSSFVLDISVGVGNPDALPGDFGQAEIKYQIGPANQPSVTPTSLTWDTSQGGVDFGYQVNDVAVTQSTQEVLYWSPSQTYDPGTATLIPGTIQTIWAGTQPGTYGPFNVSAATLGTPPPRTKYLLAVTDPDNVLGNFDPSKNVQALAVPDLAATSLNWHTNSADGGGVDLAYDVKNADLPQPANIALYWAHGATFDPANDRLAYQFNSQTAIGSYPMHVTASQLGDPFDGTNGADADLHLLLLVNAPTQGHPNGIVLESDSSNDSNNVANLDASPTGIVAPVDDPNNPGQTVQSITATGQGTQSIVIRFRPAGGALMLTQAYQICGVDHFNWLQVLVPPPGTPTWTYYVAPSPAATQSQLTIPSGPLYDSIVRPVGT
jgi:hypothetical protein